MRVASWKKRHVQRPYSRCLARGEYSIDQSQRLWKALLAQRDLTVGHGVDGGRHLVAHGAELTRAEHDLTDARAPAAEDEVIGSEPGELQLRLLDQEQVLDRLRQRAESVLGRSLELAQLVVGLGQREAPVQIDLQRLRPDVVRGHVG